MVRDYCEKCSGFVPIDELEVIQTCRQTHSSPAEYESWCRSCRGVTEGREKDAFDLAYDKAAARYDGEGKDWR